MLVKSILHYWDDKPINPSPLTGSPPEAQRPEDLDAARGGGGGGNLGFGILGFEFQNWAEDFE